jgi:restriction system protein
VSKQQPIIWGIHAGKTGDADKLFLKHSVIALGWPEMGDLNALSPNRDSYKEHLAKVRPERKPGYYPVAAGQLFRFVHEPEIGDLVVYPSKLDRQVHLGEIVGDYDYDPKTEPAYPQHRAIKWLKEVPRTKFSQGALYEIGSAMSFFQVKQFSEEFVAALQGHALLQPPKEDDSVSYVSEDIEQNTRDFIVKALTTELKGHPFAEFVAHLLGTMGYRTRLSPEGADGGIDIVAHKDELGFEPPLIKVQIKSSSDTVGDPLVSQLYGKVDRNEFGLFVSLGTYSNQAKLFARNKSNLRLVDGDELVALILEHYDQFDSRYKALLPLKRVYVPEPLENAE